MQRAQRVSALYLPHSTFLVSWQQFSSLFPHSLPSPASLCLCCRLLCLPLNCLLAVLQNTCACVCATFVSSLCSSPCLPLSLLFLRAPLYLQLVSKIASLFTRSPSSSFFAPLFIFDNFYFIGQAFFTLAMHFLGQQMFAV